MKFSLALSVLLATASSSAVVAFDTPPPLAKEASQAEGFTVPETCAFVYGDPHVFSFDNKKFDCMGSGDFILAKSYDTDFEVQARFFEGTEEAKERTKREKGWDLGTSNKAVVINTGVPGEPIIEVDADVPGNGWGPQDCQLKYLVNGREVTLGADQDIYGGAVTFQRRTAWEKSLWEDKYYTNHYRNFFFRESGVFMRVGRKYSHDFGCFMNVRICLPDEIKNQHIIGLLGNANGDPDDDFITRFGQPITKKLWWNQINDYCKENWCVSESDDSMFAKPDINGECKAHHDKALEEAIKNASDEIKDKCHQDDDCITDAIITGDIELGLRTLDEKNKKDNFDDIDPTPEDEEEDDVCRTSDGHRVPCERFTGEFTCEALNYDFGFQMDGCDDDLDGPFQSLQKTDANPTCNVGNYNVGSFDISCSKQDKEATITPTVDSVVKVSGANGGTLYTNLLAGETYTLTTGKGNKYETIQDIEFCFKCPTRVVDTSLISCAADVKTCPDGSELQRDATKECAFPECPMVEDECALPAETKKFSVITKEWSNIGAHSMYKGIAIGGMLTDQSPGSSGTVDKTMSYVHKANPDPKKFMFNFNGGVEYGKKGVDWKFWKKIEYITKHAKSGTMGNFKVEVVNKGGKFDLYDFRKGGQGEDNGKTLVIFNTDETITIEKTKDGRQFGPTIIAPNALVKVMGNAGFVDGAIIAKSLMVFGGQVQLHGDIYRGKIPCGEGEDDDDKSGPKKAPPKDDSDPKKAPPKPNSPGCSKRWAQCGGNNWTGPTTCAAGSTCVYDNVGYSQCKPAPQDPNTVAEWGQCGGNTYKGLTTCTAGTICQYDNPGYSQCKPDPNPKCPETDTEPEPEPQPEAPDSPSPEDKKTDKAFTKGDPHFKTFGGELYDFHGECDLVLLHNPEFEQGLGMDIHIRTKIEAFWSSVESAVIKLGEETMEIKGDPLSNEWLWFNGQEVTSNLKDGEWNRHRLAGYLVRYKQMGPNTREANIYLDGAKEVLVMKTFKSFVRIDINWQHSKNYDNSVGLLGSHAHDGKRLGRDGAYIKDVNAFGQEWQVRPEVDGSLFHSYEGAIVGKKCVMPPAYHEGDDITTSSLRGRRLGASALATADAEKACNHLADPEEKKACIFDVIATQDLNMASTW